MTNISRIIHTLTLTLILTSSICQAFWTPTYYNTLNVGSHASKKEIKSAYRKLALKYHPDRNSEESAKQQFLEISKAYEVLSNVEKRRKYDKYGQTSEANEVDFDELWKTMFGKDGEFGGIFDEEEKSEEEKNYEKFLNTFYTLPVTEFITNFCFDLEFGIFNGKSAGIAYWILTVKVMVILFSIGFVYLLLHLEFKLAVFIYKFCSKITFWFVLLLFWFPCFVLKRLLRGYVNIDLGKFLKELGKDSAVLKYYENMSKNRRSIFFWLAVFYVMSGQMFSRYHSHSDFFESFF